jgi:hypothetical protein
MNILQFCAIIISFCCVFVQLCLVMEHKDLTKQHNLFQLETQKKIEILHQEVMMLKTKWKK